MKHRYPGYIGHDRYSLKCLYWEFEHHYTDNYLVSFRKFDVMMFNDVSSGGSPDSMDVTYDWWFDPDCTVVIDVDPLGE